MLGRFHIGDENTGYSSLLYHGDKLYCAHEVNNGNAISIVLATLDKHLERIKSTVKSWKENDKKLSDLCIPVDPAATDKESKSCGENITTSGLVGWLSGDMKDNIWKDVYGCVDAKVTNAIATPYGAKFYGSGSGALWPVSAQGQNQRYYFRRKCLYAGGNCVHPQGPTTWKVYILLWVGAG
ncbi:hypothetical protein [Streptomyces hygroscopicus]|uniref:hypothetical protein n=1 Tax=Streptomyces hygroscopicus TaxID=1912 RepID=UPI003F1D4532